MIKFCGKLFFRLCMASCCCDLPGMALLFAFPWVGQPLSVTTVVFPPAAWETFFAQSATKGPAAEGRTFPSKKAWQLMAQKSEALHNSGCASGQRRSLQKSDFGMRCEQMTRTI